MASIATWRAAAFPGSLQQLEQLHRLQNEPEAKHSQYLQEEVEKALNFLNEGTIMRRTVLGNASCDSCSFFLLASFIKQSGSPGLAVLRHLKRGDRLDLWGGYQLQNKLHGTADERNVKGQS